MVISNVYLLMAGRDLSAVMSCAYVRLPIS
jgi:hypothetical protein